MQEALLAAATAVAGRRACRTTRAPGWSTVGRPPAGRHLAQRERAGERREEPRPPRWTRRPTPAVADQDDTLVLLFLCCHPSLSAPSQLALTLRAVGGLTTAEIANAFLVPEATMAQRISRAKQRSATPACASTCRPRRSGPSGCAVVLHVLYLIFNEGYATSSGPALQPRRPDRARRSG